MAFTEESIESWKKQACHALKQLTQELVFFTEYVHLYGRLTFDIEGKEKICVSLSEMITPAAFSDLGHQERLLDNDAPSKQTPLNKNSPSCKRRRKKTWKELPQPEESGEIDEDIVQNVKQEHEDVEQDGDRISENSTTYTTQNISNTEHLDKEQEQQEERLEACSRGDTSEMEIEDEDEANQYENYNSTDSRSKEKPEQCPHCTARFTTKYRLEKHITNIHSSTVSCAHCEEVFHKTTELKLHFRERHPAETFPLVASCDVCFEMFPSTETLQEHKKKSHSHPCDFCQHVFFHIVELDKHFVEVHPNQQPVCNICQRNFSTLKLLRKHKKTSHKKKEERKVCQECSKVCASAYALYLHQRAVHKKVGFYACNLCDKTFVYHNTLKLHKLHHAGERPFKCPNCEKTYLSSSHLKGHIAAVHSGEKKHACPVCNKRFPYEHSLKMHMHLHTGQRRFLCDVCSKGLITAAALRNHEALHHHNHSDPNNDSNNPAGDCLPLLYACATCGKTYRTPAQLRGHERRHTEDRNRYMCDMCGCTFMYRSNLDAHAAVHRDERTFACTVCAKRFRTYATLYLHGKCHQQEKPFICEVCAKSFKTKEILKRHQQRHSGEKPFKCNQCQSCFPDKGGLSKHLKTVHTSKPNFQCPKCLKTCSRADNLRVHMKSHNDPDLLKLSREQLMINKEAPDSSSVPSSTNTSNTTNRLDMAQVLLQTAIDDATPTIVTTGPSQNQPSQQPLQPLQQQYIIHSTTNTLPSSQSTDIALTVPATVASGGGMIALQNLYMVDPNTQTLGSVGTFPQQHIPQ